MGLFQEFRQFVARGNVVDLAVGVVIGAAFGKIVNGLVDQIIMPPVGLIIGRVDFAQLKVVLKAANPETRTAEVAIGYGAFLNSVFQFLILAFAMFLVVKGMNILRRREAEKPTPDSAPTPTEALLTEIRDILKARQQP